MASSSTPSSTSSKRKRTDQKDDPANLAVVESWSSFFNAPDADIILRSVDGRLFATRRTFLVAASSVFDDMFGLPQPIEGGQGSKKNGQAAPAVLQVVEMVERGDELERFLRWIHRDTLKAARNEADNVYENFAVLALVLPLFKMASKFNVPFLPPLIVQTLRWPAGGVFHLNQLAVGIIHDMPTVVEDALLQWVDMFDNKDPPPPSGFDANHSSWNPRLKHVHEGWRPTGLPDIDRSLYPLLPPDFPGRSPCSSRPCSIPKISTPKTRSRTF